MSLPPWKASRPEDREAFARFIIDALDAEDANLARRAGDNPAVTSYLAGAIDLIDRAARLGARVVLPAPPAKRGVKAGDPTSDVFPAFNRAALDVPRIRKLFVRHWGKRNRTERPMAEEIAAQRWDLSPDETVALIQRFQRKS